MEHSDPPPPKRPRYAEVAGLIPKSPLISGSWNSDAPVESPNVATANTPLGKFGGPVTNGSSSSSSSSSSPSSGFDPKVFATFTGEEVPLDILRELEDVSGGDMQRAINM